MEKMEIAIYYCCIRSGNLNAGKHISRKDGASIFGTYVDIICYNADRIDFQQFNSRKSRREHLVFDIWILHDHAYCFGCNPICIKSKE